MSDVSVMFFRGKLFSYKNVRLMFIVFNCSSWGPLLGSCLLGVKNHQTGSQEWTPGPHNLNLYILSKRKTKQSTPIWTHYKVTSACDIHSQTQCFEVAVLIVTIIKSHLINIKMYLLSLSPSLFPLHLVTFFMDSPSVNLCLVRPL